MDCIDKDKFTECPDSLKDVIVQKDYGTSNLGSYEGFCKEISSCNDLFIVKRSVLKKDGLATFLNSDFKNAFDKCYVNAQSHKETVDGEEKLYLQDNYQDCFNREMGIGDSCKENWECDEWNSCSGGTQSRTCLDLNKCGTIFDRPATSQICSGSTTPINCGSTPGDMDLSDPDTYYQNNPGVKEILECSSNNLKDCIPSSTIYPNRQGGINTLSVLRKEGNSCVISYDSDPAGKGIECKYRVDYLKSLYNVAGSNGVSEQTAISLAIAFGIELLGHSPGDTFNQGNNQGEIIPCTVY